MGMGNDHPLKNMGVKKKSGSADKTHENTQKKHSYVFTMAWFHIAKLRKNLHKKHPGHLYAIEKEQEFLFWWFEIL